MSLPFEGFSPPPHLLESVMRQPCLVSLVIVPLIVAFTQTGLADEPAPPDVLLNPYQGTHDHYHNLLRMPDDEIWKFRAYGNNEEIRYRISDDDGDNWPTGSNYETISVPGMTGSGNPIPIYVKQTDGSYHLNFARFQNDHPSDGLDINLYYYKVDSVDEETGHVTMTNNMIYNGDRVQFHMGMQTQAGRIIIPFADLNGSPSGPPYGRFKIKTIHSDNRGTSWAVSSSELQTPVPSDFNGAGNGAVEPFITQLAGNNLWMLMTTQTGRHYQSFSSDSGGTWSTPEETDFYCTTGWARVLRLDDGPGHSPSDPYDAPLVLLWTNATMPLKHDGDWWYSGRDTLHAAISHDNGQTWSGYREIYLDPTRNDPASGGDAGAALPFATLTHDGKIIAITGQSTGKAMIRFDPAWLELKHHAESFETVNNTDPLYDWSVFKHYGEVGAVANNKRQRIASAAVVEDPENDSNHALRIRRAQKLAADGQTVLEPGDTGYNDVTNTLLDGDGAVWNFPVATRARTEMKLYLHDGSGGGVISLTDRFFNPNDDQVEDDSLAFFALDFDGSGELTSGHELDADTWYGITLDWSVAQRKAIVYVDGEQVGVVNTPTGVEALPGLSYLRFRSTAAGLDSEGFLVDDIHHVGENIGDTVRLTTTAASDILASPPTGWTAIQFDDYVPNDLVTGGNPSGNGTIDTFAGVFTGFTDPATAAAPVGIVVESSTGSVVFSDNTSQQITSDLRGPADGESLLIRFVDPSDTDTVAAVCGVAWRFGSVATDNVAVILYDAEGNVLPDWEFAAMESGVSGQVGFTGLLDGETAAVIHAIEFIGTSSDVWVLGSFNQDTGWNDFAFADFTVLTGQAVVPIPEPASLGLLGAALLCGARRGRRRCL